LKAIIYSKHGGPEVLQLQELPKPVPADNEVLVKVHAVSINDWDWAILQNKTFLDRILPKPKSRILGSDIAGKIETVGKNVMRFKAGDEVFGDLSGKWGGFAEYVCANENSIAIKSPGMTFEQAAAIPQAGMLAVQGLIDRGQIKPGQKILLNGAGGGVGTFAIQIAKLYEVEVTVVDSADKLDLLREMGAAHTIDYTKQDFTKNGLRYDLVLDTKTNRPVHSYLRSLTPNGIYATVGGSINRLLQAFIFSPWISWFTGKKLRVVALKANKDLAYLNKLFEAGKVIPVIDGHYKLKEIADAFQLFERAGHKGKIVITVVDKGG
jgi:NADPH:quinone reductase-like Zn-dependent oxidoreductase